jgi:hypothetical protein
MGSSRATDARVTRQACTASVHGARNVAVVVTFAVRASRPYRSCESLSWKSGWHKTASGRGFGLRASGFGLRPGYAGRPGISSG